MLRIALRLCACLALLFGFGLGLALAWGAAQRAPMAALLWYPQKQGRSNIAFYDAPTGLLHLVTRSPDLEGNLVWSPDGQSLAYFTPNGWLRSDAAFRFAQMLPVPLQAGGLRWSQDGAALVYTLPSADGMPDIWRYRWADGLSERLLASSNRWEALPYLYADGRVVYWVMNSAYQQTTLMQVSAEGERPLYACGGCSPLGWEADGTGLWYTDAEGIAYYYDVIQQAAHMTELPMPPLQQTQAARLLAWVWRP